MNTRFTVTYLLGLLVVVSFAWAANQAIKMALFIWKTSEFRKRWEVWKREHLHQIGSAKRILRSWRYRIWPQTVVVFHRR